jgi:hypothetical protein
MRSRSSCSPVAQRRAIKSSHAIDSPSSVLDVRHNLGFADGRPPAGTDDLKMMAELLAPGAAAIIPYGPVVLK